MKTSNITRVEVYYFFPDKNHNGNILQYNLIVTFYLEYYHSLTLVHTTIYSTVFLVETLTPMEPCGNSFEWPTPCTSVQLLRT